jgi:hypothetical protein
MAAPSAGENILHVRVLLPPSTSLADASCLAAAWSAFAAAATCGHPWQHEPLRFCVSRSPTPSLLASLRYGECVEDEWLATWLVFRLSAGACGGVGSAAGAGAVVQLEDDADGDFLLAHGADHLPRWLSSPAGARNRFFLYRGELHALPPRAAAGAPPHLPGAPPHLPGAPPALAAAAAHVRAHAHATLAPAPLRACIAARLAPFDAALPRTHRAAAAVPAAAAWALHAAPQALLAAAVEAVLEAAEDAGERGLPAGLAALPVMGPGGAACAPAAAAAAAASLPPLLVVPLVFSRVQFAQLLRLPLLAPARGAFAAAAKALEAAGGEPARAAGELGYKLCVGLEALLAAGPAGARAALRGGGGAAGAGASAAAAAAAEAALGAGAVETVDSVLDCAPPPPHGALLIATALTAPPAAPALNAWPPAPGADDSLQWLDEGDAEVDAYLAAATAAAAPRGEGGGAAVEEGDDDSEDEADDDGDGSSSGGGGDDEDGDGEALGELEAEGVQQLEKLVSAMKIFVKRKSGPEGVEVADEDEGRGEESSGSGSSDEEDEEERGWEEEEGGAAGGVQGAGAAPPLAPLRAAQMEELLRCAASGLSALPPSLAAALSAAGLLAPAAPPAAAGGGAPPPAGASLREIMAAQDAALLAASPAVLGASFPRRADGSVDEERSLAGAAAQGVAAQGGAAGPTSTLMGVLGVDVPRSWW